MNAPTKAAMVALILGLGGCSSSLSGTDGGGNDRAPDNAPSDVADCHCSVDQDGFLVMSWDCYCALGTGTRCSQGCTAGSTTYVGCGAMVSATDSAAGTSYEVRDSSGTLIGAQDVFDVMQLACPSDPSIRSTKGVRAGQQPDPTCQQRTSCGCPAGAKTCAVDGGGPDPCDCHVEGGELTMSWDCYCAKWGCDGRLSCSTGQDRLDYVACGFTVVSRQSFGITRSVYDTTGALVGQTQQSDSTPYVCPSNAALSAGQVTAGQAPASSCLGVACGACTTTPWPCGGLDAGTSQ